MDKYMELAYKEALKSLKTDDVPVGTVIVEKGNIIAKAHNTREKKYQITGHAEINAVEKACNKKQTWHLEDCELYVTLKPCKMCQEVIKQARIKRIYYMCEQNKVINESEINFIKMEDNKEVSHLITNFFKNKRNIKK